jgi:hypothetical protein
MCLYPGNLWRGQVEILETSRVSQIYLVALKTLFGLMIAPLDAKRVALHRALHL